MDSGHIARRDDWHKTVCRRCFGIRTVIKYSHYRLETPSFHHDHHNIVPPDQRPKPPGAMYIHEVTGTHCPVGAGCPAVGGGVMETEVVTAATRAEPVPAATVAIVGA